MARKTTDPKGKWRSLLLLLLTLLIPWDPAWSSSSHFNVIKIQDTINPGVEDFISYAISTSERDGAHLLVILLDTPGGLLTATRGIVQAILNASVPIVVFVSPSGAQAASAGVFITAAADIAAMAPGTNIGAAHPVTTGGGDVPSTMGEKVVNDTVAFARSIADQRGRNGNWLEKAVRKSISATAHEAFAENVIDLVASDLPDLLKRLDGWEIEHKGRKTRLSTLKLEERTLAPGWQHKVLRTISNPNIAYLLLMIGLAGLYFELSQPGAILPGVIGGISLILALYALQTLPVNYAGVLLILLAVLFFLLEIKVASYGMLSVAGVLCLVLGSLMLFRVPGSTNPLALSVFVPTVLLVSAFFVTVATLAFRAQLRKPEIGGEAMEGLTGEVMQELNPQGKVFVSGELWNAESDDPIGVGEKVVVTSVENLKLKVKKMDAK
ncbi:MAG: nodulation protein NfeD [Deltaproteobacteria bacterium]|nr:nodulation protein NfeD [Deltaproteobacteria bacterium]